jgi:hypothetical protein
MLSTNHTTCAQQENTHIGATMLVLRAIRVSTYTRIGGNLLLSLPLSLVASLVIGQVVDENQSMADIQFGLTLGEFLAVWNAGSTI